MNRGFKDFLSIGQGIVNEFADEGLKEWDKVAKNIPILIENGELRGKVKALPVINVFDFANDLGMVKRLYTMVTFIAHAYIQGRTDEVKAEIIPAKLAKPWIDSGKLLGIPPVATYSATVLFNCRWMNNFVLEDVKLEYTFTGTEDEKWFYAVSAGIDAKSGMLLDLIEEITESDDYETKGIKIAEKIDELSSVLNRMYEKCDAKVFTFQIRRFFEGWLHEGMKYENDEGDSILLKLAGGSAAQNPTIQLLDIFLGVKHGEMVITGYVENDSQLSGCPMNYLRAMRTYMPLEHRLYLDSLESKLKSKSEWMASFKSSEAFKGCVEALVKFRNEHIKMVARYVVNQCPSSRGTGGSNPLPFLKKCRDETIESSDSQSSSDQ